ncbi:MAG TPA: hypothetical protein VNJ09_04205, partial [Chthonomonadales bacterium]|nr:hypothetical protein [Chthonomonadales bacterium]
MNDPINHMNGIEAPAITGVNGAEEPKAQSREPREKTRNPGRSKAPGLKIARHFTGVLVSTTASRGRDRSGEDVWNTVEWEKRSAVITGEKGNVVFEQHDVEVPATWSQLATNVVA